MKSNLNPWIGSKILKQSSNQPPPTEEKKCIKVFLGRNAVNIEINVQCLKNKFFKN